MIFKEKKGNKGKDNSLLFLFGGAGNGRPESYWQRLFSIYTSRRQAHKLKRGLYVVDFQ